MSDRAGRDEHRLLTPFTAAVLLAVGITSFVAMLLLGAYAPDLRPGNNGGAHALSDAATGYSGLVRLAAETGRNPRIVRNVHLVRTEDLVVATPESGSVRVDPVLAPRPATPTLLVLPKWTTVPDRAHPGWVDALMLRPLEDVQGVLAPAATFRIVQRRGGGQPLRTLEPLMAGVSFTAPGPLQAIGPGPGRDKGAYGALRPLIVDDAGNIVLGRFAGRPLYVLADPDLLDNRGLRDPRTAASALAMLDWMNATGNEGIAFDVTLNGFGHGASPLKLLFEPPFLAVTLTLAATALLAALGTVARFGSPRPRERAIAFGKAALVDNTAALVRKAGRETRLGGRYVDVIREAAGRAFAVPARLQGDDIDAHLDGIAGRERFTGLVEAVKEARSKAELVSAARALHDWMGEGNR